MKDREKNWFSKKMKRMEKKLKEEDKDLREIMKMDSPEEKSR